MKQDSGPYLDRSLTSITKTLLFASFLFSQPTALHEPWSMALALLSAMKLMRSSTEMRGYTSVFMTLNGTSLLD